MTKTTLIPLTYLVTVLLTLAAASRPNLIVFMADDLGYETLSANGGSPYKTPNLDRLAEEGIRFTNCVAQPLCTPSRVKIMTGRFNIRNYREFGTLDPRETTFGSVLRQAGYNTCIAGKWQLGKDRKLINHFGFDEYCLWWLERKAPRYNNVGELIQNGTVMPGKNGGYGPDVVNAFVLDFISRHRDTPFLCYYPMILTHSPFEPTPDSPPGTTKKSPLLDRMKDMVTYADKIVGQTVEHLEALGLRDDTLILFTGDNGTDRSIQGGRLGILDWPGGKGCNFVEMGMRVPMVISYPKGGISGLVTDDPVDLADIFPTLVELAKAEVPAGLAIDGHSFAGRLTGSKDYQPHPWAYVSYYGKKRGALSHFVRDRQYKLYGGDYFYDFTADPLHQRPIDVTKAPPSALKSYHMLRNALKQLESEIPAGDRYTGKPSRVVTTKPGPQNLRPKTEAQAAQE